MNRLTYKLEQPIKTKYLNFNYLPIPDYDIKRGNYDRITDDMLYNKLGQLEDLEEELEIDLITLIKALREPVYVIINKKIVETQCGHIGEDCKFIDFEVDGKDYRNMYDIETYCVLVKEYGKTWALTKEELEK